MPSGPPRHVPERPQLRTTDEDYVEAVLSLAEQVPPGCATTYGAIADALLDVFGGGPRQVGRVMALHGAGVPWWRVVRADGTLPEGHADRAREHYLEEGTPRRPSGAVDLRRGLWVPPAPPDGVRLP